MQSIIFVPWLVIGDMNEVLSPFENEGNLRLHKYMQAFMEVIAHAN